ncbi:phosphomannomutase CpsG [Vibrio cholerae]|uniref:phosphomannomutase CpsG n=1 Tax=Vibrio cholerae TaxID=666 RepID=UPI0011DB0E23|nr:phosphomannomutase CpsG [Vibrio cholerae]TXY76644.1 phosphomannomutase CpsG [Vibrio cholerae]BCN21213.1 phosphomannomutase/phosphoglucomutase [Vibrio cholerae]BCN21876.1 phosphomannomutase/phosphoglucomutase [Vibrio cholerae]GHX92017.1 phosphoglucomutase/phosphomannomutase,alpha/ beta/alpha domain III family protein [Vibrio cholerae]GIB17763.1 phosphoglucomutase/phosphomannomutase,alpha/ beta/alpha domain III family protein [Vibrio cholerae]
MTELTCFKAYDIRGQLGTELDNDISYRIGRAYGQFLKSENDADKTVVVGGDVRLTSEALKQALANGLMDAGVNVIDLGVTGTEEIYFATFHLGVDGGIEVTASHNPMDYNGMKLVREGSKPISGDTGLREIQALAEKNEFMDVEVKGNYKKVSLLQEYVDHLMSYITPANIKPMKLVINSGNGAAGHVIDELEKRFNALSVPLEIIKVHHEEDGNFPNGIPNPLLPECRADTAKAVKEHKADMGIAFDGDFDRCFLFDENGDFIEGYYIVGLLAEAFLQKEQGAKIIHDPRLSWNTIDVVTKAGGIPVMSKTGHAFIKERMRKEDAIYGGEMSAHHYFRDFAYCDSGMIPWLLVAELLSVKSMKLSETVSERIAAYPSSGEINSKLANPKEAIQCVLDTYKGSELVFDETDGISLEFNDWRFNLRSSNTEPVVRLNVESRENIALMEEKTQSILSILRR